ncbi:unnamed protein product, partial [Polarella glacialis]
ADSGRGLGPRRAQDVEEDDDEYADDPVVQELLRLDLLYIDLDQKLRVERQALERKYGALYAPILTRRRQRLAAVDVPGFAPEPSQGQSSSSASTAAPVATPAVPGFWRTVLQNSGEFQEDSEWRDPSFSTSSPIRTAHRIVQFAGEMMEVVAIGAIYIMISATLITFNKYMMQPGHFPHAVHLTAIHMSVTFALALSLYQVAPSLFPTMERSRQNWKLVLTYVAPLGMTFAVALLFSNQAYQYSSVAFLQFCKEGNVALVFAMSCAVGLQTFSWQKVLVLSVVIAGCSVCTTGEINFVWLGFLLQICSQVAECTKNILGEVVMTGAGLKLDVLTFVTFQAPCSLAPLLVGSFVAWSPEVMTDFLAIWPLLLANACVAFLLNVTIATTLKRLATLAFVIIGLVKDIVIICSSAFIFGDKISHQQLSGFTVTLVGIALWSHLKMREQAASNKEQQVLLAEPKSEKAVA